MFIKTVQPKAQQCTSQNLACTLSIKIDLCSDNILYYSTRTEQRCFQKRLTKVDKKKGRLTKTLLTKKEYYRHFNYFFLSPESGEEVKECQNTQNQGWLWEIRELCLSSRKDPLSSTGRTQSFVLFSVMEPRERHCIFYGHVLPGCNLTNYFNQEANKAIFLNLPVLERY